MPQKQSRSLRRNARKLVAAHRFNLWLGVSMAAANVLGYAAIVVISGSFGPAAFGAVGALTSLGVIASIPAGTLTVIIGGRVSRGRNVSWAYALGVVVGMAEWLLIVAMSPLLVQVFDLTSAWPLFWLGLSLVAMTMIGAQQGLLLGSNKLGRLALLFLFGGVTRLAAAVACVLIEPTVSIAYLFWLVATTLGLLLGIAFCRGLQPLHGHLQGLMWQAATLGKVSVGLLALITLTSIDTIFARHLLSAHDSGIYAVASMFAKVIFWGTQFIAMIVIPRIAKRSGHFLILKAYAAVVTLSLPVVLVIAVNPLFWLTSVGLDDYEEAARLLIRFATLGILWSLIQISIFADMTGDKNQMPKLISAGLALQTTLTFTWLGSTPTEIWLAAFLAAAFVIVTALLRMALIQSRSRRERITGNAS